MTAPNDTVQAPSLFDRLGGMAAITTVVDKFYERVLADPELSPFFARTNMSRLRKRQTQFFAQATGGPAGYKGRDMKSAHKNLGIRQQHFDRVTDHLVDTLEALEVPANLIDEVIAPMQADIVTTADTPAPPRSTGAPSMSTTPEVPSTAAGAPSSNGQLDSLEFVLASLGSVQANIFLADPKFTIVYANDRALETLRTIEDEVRKAFGVEVDDIVGASIHRFHRDKRRVERILRNPAALPHQAEFTFGSTTLQTTINGIFGPRNEVLGYVVNWEDVTQHQRMKAEQSRLTSMLENAPTNVIMADRDLNIIYVNPASVATLRKLERHLPVKPENVLGSNIDIFHKNPAYQRKIIEQIGTIINQINDIQNTIASAVEEQTATTGEISRNVGEAAKGSSEIAQNITGVAQAARSTTEGASNTQSSADELLLMAVDLQKLVSQFKF